MNRNALALATAIDAGSNGQPVCRHVGDDAQGGTFFTFYEGRWFATDLEDMVYLGSFERLAVVRLGEEANPSHGLGGALGYDFAGDAEWVVDAEKLPELRNLYRQQLVIVWEQEVATVRILIDRERRAKLRRPHQAKHR